MTTDDDQVLRAITDDNTFRVIVASTTQTVRGVLDAQGATGQTGRYLAELVTGAVLVRETMSPHHRLQAVLTGKQGRGRVVADTHPDGSTRGLVHLPPDWEQFRLGNGSMLQVMRTMANGSIYRGLVDTAEQPDVSGALMAYLQESEQTVSVIGSGMCQQGDEIQIAGGYVVQLLPDANRDALQTMTRRLESLTDTESLLRRTGGSARRTLEELLQGSAFCQLDDRPVRFHCGCNQEAVVATLSTLDRSELDEIIREQGVLELTCDYCRTPYRVGRGQLQGLLEPS
jgi:molecular chaperone Hsp33